MEKMQKAICNSFDRESKEWAFDALKAYSQSLLTGLNVYAADFSQKSKVQVAVYGATQVGKTALLLSLLGIEGEFVDEVSHVLRGGRSLGNSATSRAIAYECSPDHTWYIGARCGLSNQEASAEISQLRLMMESGQCIEQDILVIKIPKQFFMSSSSQADVELIDLPGIHAKNQNESEYVQQLTAKIIQGVDSILLVGKVDFLGFLRQEELGLEYLKYWDTNSVKFKVVLTHTFSDASIQTFIGQEKPNLQHLQAYISEQFKTHGLKIDANNIFPIEVGKSWEYLVAQKDLSKELVSLCQESLQALNMAITSIQDPLIRLREGYVIFDILKKKKIELEINKSDIESKIRASIAEEENKKGEYSQQINIFQNGFNRILKKNKLKEYILSEKDYQNLVLLIRDLEAEITNQTIYYQTRKLIDNLEPLDLKDIDYPLDQPQEDLALWEKNIKPIQLKLGIVFLREYISDYNNVYEKLKKKYIELNTSIKKTTTTNDLIDIRLTLSSYLNELYQSCSKDLGISKQFDSVLRLSNTQKLEEYVFKTYYRDKSFNHDISSIKEDLEVDLSVISDAIEQLINRFFKNNITQLKINLIEVLDNISKISYLISNVEKKISLLKQELDKNSSIINRNITELDELMLPENAFVGYIEERFNMRLNELQQCCETETTGVLKNILMLRHTKKQFEYIKSLERK